MSTTILTEPKPELERPAADTDPGLTEPTATQRMVAVVIARDPATPVRLRYATPALSRPAPRKAVARPKRAASARRRVRLDWEAISVILLMLACAAVGVYRLIWMGQI